VASEECDEKGRCNHPAKVTLLLKTLNLGVASKGTGGSPRERQEYRELA